VPHSTDLDVTAKEVAGLASPDTLTAFLARLGYDTSRRALLSPEAVGLSGESASAVKRIELLSKDPEQFLRVVFAQPRSLTAKVRNDLVRVLGRSTLDHLLVLDLVAARHFGRPEAAGLLTDAAELKLESRERFLGFLEEDERQLVEAIAALAHRPDRRFFHWEIEFPEVFFGFQDWDQRQLRHKNDLEDGAAGFDAIVGNPPYVRQESIKDFKDFLKAHYATYTSTNDLYVFFQEQEVRLLKAGGRMGMIVANKWMRAGYGEKLRDFLLHTAQPLEIIDFGHAPIFPDADTFPCILVVARRNEPLGLNEDLGDGEMTHVCEVPREHWSDRLDIGSFVLGRRHAIATNLFRREGWSLEKPKVTYQDLAWFSEFSQDDRGTVPNNIVYLIAGCDPALLAVLNSQLMWWYMWRTAQHAKDEVLRLFTDFVVAIPIPRTLGSAEAMRSVAVRAMGQQERIQGFEQETERSAARTFSLPSTDGRLISWLALAPDTFADRVLRLAGVKRPADKLRAECRAFQETARARQVELLRQQLVLEKELAGLVEEAYGLTPEERALLRSTRPVRDPLDVLEAKIRGAREGAMGSTAEG
jgi:hypothetical protein